MKSPGSSLYEGKCTKDMKILPKISKMSDFLQFSSPTAGSAVFCFGAAVAAPAPAPAELMLYRNQDGRSSL